MYVNTGGVGKTQQQPLQNQTNPSVRHNNPYPHTQTQQQPHYEPHQVPVKYVPYQFCNLASATHGNTGGNNVCVGSGQTGHLIYPTSHQIQTQTLPPQQPVGLHNAEQTLHYFQKNIQLPAHSLHHPPPTHHVSHPQMRNMIATVSHQQQSYMVSQNYITFQHAIMQQQTRAPILSNAAPQHAVAAAGVGSVAKQLQNTAPRSIAPNGPTAYVPQPYCTPPLLLGTSPTGVTPQLAPMFTQTTGIGQPPPLKAYTHITSGLSEASTFSTPINMLQNVGLLDGTPSTTEHNTKERRYAIPIIHPDTLEIVNTDSQPQVQPEPQKRSQIQIQIRNEIKLESVSIQTDNEKSLTESIASDPSDAVLPMHSQSISATETDKIYCSVQNEQDGYDIAIPATFLPNVPTTTTATTILSATDENTTTQSIHSGSEFLKMVAYEDPNDTDADTNEHELDHEDDVLDTTDGNLDVVELPTSTSVEQQTEEIPVTELHILKDDESDATQSKETDAKSKDEPYGVSVQTSLDRNDEEKSKEIMDDLQPSVSSFVVSEAKRKKGRKAAKTKEKKLKKSKQQQNKCSSIPTQREETKTSSENDKKFSETKEQKQAELTKKEDKQPIFIRYSLKELRDFSKSPASRKIPLMYCQKGDIILQLLVAGQQHRHHQGQNSSSVNMQQRVQASYHQRNFSDSTDMVNVKRRGGAFIGRKLQDVDNSLGSLGANNASLQVGSATPGVGINTGQIHKEMQVIRINLSLNEEIKLSECKNAWQPKFLSNNQNNNSFTTESGKNSNDIEDVLKKVRGILNKLTAENFDVLLKEMTGITINSQEKMEKIMLLIFEKTVSEPNFAPTYAKFCKVLFDEVKAENKEAFKGLLMNRLKLEFESNVDNADAKERKLQQIIDKLNCATDPHEKIELQAELEHQEYQFRRRAWGTVRFIGEMYKLQSLSANRVLLCVESLLQQGNEEKLEYMCKLLTTVGSILESSDPKTFNNIRMNKIFEKIQAIVKDSKDPSKRKSKICSRVRFMMQDLIDLRAKNWGQASAQGSHTSQRKRLSEDQNSNIQSSSATSYDRGSSQRLSFGNNNRQNQMRTKDSGMAGNSSNFFMQKSSKCQYSAQREQYSIDLKKLNFSRGDDSSQATTELGNSSNYKWRTVMSRHTSQSSDSHQKDRNSPTSSYQQCKSYKEQQHTQHSGVKLANSNSNMKAILESYSSKENQRLLNQLLEEYLDCMPSRSNQWQEEVLSIWEKTNKNQQICLVHYILMDYLHLAAVKSLERNACGNICVYLMNRRNTLNKTIFIRAYEHFAEEFPDLLVDVPNGWTYVIQFLGPLLHERLIKFSDIWLTSWRDDHTFAERFVIALVAYFTKDFGAKYMKDLWHKEFKLDQGQVFKSDPQEWGKFVTAKKLQFLYDSKTKPDTSFTNANTNSSTMTDHHVQRLEVLLSSPNDSNLALDYISTNINTNSNFLKELTKFLCCSYATTTKTITAATSRASSATTSKNSSTCSNTSSNSSTKNPNISSNNNSNNNTNNNTKYVHLNIKTFRNNCLPLLRLCLDGHEDRELACLDSVAEAIQLEYDANTADDLIRGIFDILYDDDVIAKESFQKWLEKNESKTFIKSFVQDLL